MHTLGVLFLNIGHFYLLDLTTQVFSEQSFETKQFITRTKIIQGQNWFVGQMSLEGMNKGKSEGDREGDREGVLEGLADGLLAEGMPEGLVDGLPDGFEEGLAEGMPEGLVDGLPEGEVVLVFFAFGDFVDKFAFGNFVVFRMRMCPIKPLASWALKAGMQSIESTNTMDLMRRNMAGD